MCIRDRERSRECFEYAKKKHKDILGLSLIHIFQKLPCFRVELKADQSALGAVCHQQVPAVRCKNHVAGMDAAAPCLLDLLQPPMAYFKDRYDLGKSGGYI